jgi:hypothetical protein
LDCSGYSSNQTIDLVAGDYSSIGGLNGNIGIAYGCTIENAIGGMGADNITGNSTDNTLRGDGGNDTIDGGAGTDSAVFAGPRSAYTLTALAGNGVRVVGPDGTDTLTNIERLVFDDQTVTWPPAASTISINDVAITEGNSGTKIATFTVTRAGGTAAFDVNFATADGTARIADNDYTANSGMLHFGVGVNTQTITVTINGDTKPELNEAFFVNLSAPTNGATLSDSSGTGTIVNDDAAMVFATDHFGNFNGDSADDYLWRNSDGTVGIWQMSAAGPSPANVASASTDWHIEGTGDFNGDQRGDILWRNDSGQVGEWQMNGSSALPVNVLSVSADWHIKGVGDFNGDHRSDILWENDNGALGEWQMNGGSATPVNLPSPGFSWYVVGIGDFNADGRDDILWRSDSGQVGAWLMNGGAATPVNFGSAGSDWHIVGTGDFNGDGRTDILWRSDSGQIGEWQATTSGGMIPFNIASVTSDWHIVATGDVNGDSTDDIVWRNDNGAVGEWLMHGSSATPQNLPSVASTWAIGGHHFDFV